MSTYTNAPEAGKAYQNPDGTIMAVDEIKPNGYWLCRFIHHVNERKRGNHRQWVPFWSKDFFVEVPMPTTIDEQCDCAGCTSMSPLIISPLGV